jgi:hypothetical protein
MYLPKHFLCSVFGLFCQFFLWAPPPFTRLTPSPMTAAAVAASLEKPFYLRAPPSLPHPLDRFCRWPLLLKSSSTCGLLPPSPDHLTAAAGIAALEKQFYLRAPPSFPRLPYRCRGCRCSWEAVLLAGSSLLPTPGRLTAATGGRCSWSSSTCLQLPHFLCLLPLLYPCSWEGVLLAGSSSFPRRAAPLMSGEPQSPDESVKQQISICTIKNWFYSPNTEGLPTKTVYSKWLWRQR